MTAKVTYHIADEVKALKIQVNLLNDHHVALLERTQPPKETTWLGGWTTKV